jgi:hypothetical protein
MRPHLNRRRFLQAAAAVGASGFLPRLAVAAEKASTGPKLLMLDPKALQSRSNIELRMQRPTRHPDNPIMRPEKPWEFSYIFATTVRCEPKTERWRMWYLGTATDKAIDKGFCLAESKDGLRWERPNLGLSKFHDSRDNNMLGIDPGPVLFDPHEADEKRRYKTLGNPEVASHANVHFSGDGVNWTPSKRNPVVKGIGDTHGFLGWDERIDKYVVYWRLPGHDRQYAYATSSDFEEFDAMKRLQTVDEHDPVGTYVYHMMVWKTAGLYLCIAPVLHVDRGLKDNFHNNPAGLEQTLDMQMMLSYDGIEWQRLFNRQPFLQLGTHESWDDAQLHPTLPVTVGDETRLYYSGANFRHGVKEIALCGKEEGGRWRGMCIGLATLKRDRWQGAVAGAREGELLTKPFPLNGTQIKLNAEVGQGRLLGELTDADGKTLAGFGRNDCQLGKQVGLEHTLTWKEGELGRLKGKEVCLRVVLTRAELYALEVS